MYSLEPYVVAIRVTTWLSSLAALFFFVLVRWFSLSRDRASAVIFASSASKQGGSAKAVDYEGDFFRSAVKAVRTLRTVCCEYRQQHHTAILLLLPLRLLHPPPALLRWTGNFSQRDTETYVRIITRTAAAGCVSTSLWTGVVNVARACLEAKVPRLVVVSSGGVASPDSSIYKFLNLFGEVCLNAALLSNSLWRGMSERSVVQLRVDANDCRPVACVQMQYMCGGPGCELEE